MMNKKIGFFILTMVLLSFLLFARAEAITASIGNSRMVLNAETGEEVERYILIRNVNDIDANVKLSASGQLNDTIKIRDDNFTLKSGDEKKAYFTIMAKEPGTTESKILIQFTGVGDKNGVGLASTVTFVASGESIKEDSGGFFGFGGSKNNSIGNSNSGKSESSNNDEGFQVSPIILLSISTSILVLIFLIMIIILSRKKTKMDKRPVTEKKSRMDKKTEIEKKVVKKSVGRARGNYR